MEKQNEINTYSVTPDTTPRIIQYAELVPIIQLSIARRINIPGSIEAESFAEIALSRSMQERRQLEIEIGSHFDEALISFIMGAIIANRRRPLVIEAEADAGINGYLPWHDRLNERLEACRDRGILVNASVTVEQKPAPQLDASAQELYEQALEFAA